MAKTFASACLVGSMTLASVVADAGSPQFVPPAGYSGKPGPGVAQPAEPGTPPLQRLPDASLSASFKVDPAYARRRAAELAASPPDPRAIAPPDPRDAAVQVKVVGAFAIMPPPHTHLVAAWALGFLPVTLAFSDGSCFALRADYTGGTLSTGRLNRASCERRSHSYRRPLPPHPSDPSLRLADAGWAMSAWLDTKSGRTIVTVPNAKAFQPFFTTKMTVVAVMSMGGIDYAGGDVTLVGQIGGRLTVVTLEYNY